MLATEIHTCVKHDAMLSTSQWKVFHSANDKSVVVPVKEYSDWDDENVLYGCICSND